MELAGLYTPLPIALRELKRRREDKVLVRKVEDYFSSLPALLEFQDEPRAVMARAVIAANLELEYFANTLKQIDLKTVFYEFASDRFTPLNPEKMALGHMIFYRNLADGTRTIIGSKRVVDFNRYQGKPLNTVLTTWDEDLIAFHHRLIAEHFPEVPMQIIDFSKWFREAKKFSPEYPYLRYLGLFLVDGILFDNFTDRKDELPFTEGIVIPAYNKLVEIFGVPPIIVPIEPLEVDDQPHWYCYDERIKTYVDRSNVS